MAMLFVLAFLVLAGVFSAISRDSHDFDDHDRRGWWPGRR
jgi:hypothetical protein